MNLNQILNPLSFIMENHQLTETVVHCPGHKDSSGKSATWCIKQHDTGKILSSHPSKEKAEEHLQQMEMHKHMEGN